MLLEDWEMINKYGTEEEKQAIEKKIKIGVFQDTDRPEWTSEWKKYVKRLR
jgi:hypothetical protein